MLLAGIPGTGCGLVVGIRADTVHGQRLLLPGVGIQKLLSPGSSLCEDFQRLGICGMGIQVEGQIIDDKADLIDFLQK